MGENPLAPPGVHRPSSTLFPVGGNYETPPLPASEIFGGARFQFEDEWRPSIRTNQVYSDLPPFAQHYQGLDASAEITAAFQPRSRADVPNFDMRARETHRASKAVYENQRALAQAPAQAALDIHEGWASVPSQRPIGAESLAKLQRFLVMPPTLSGRADGQPIITFAQVLRQRADVINELVGVEDFVAAAAAAAAVDCPSFGPGDGHNSNGVEAAGVVVPVVSEGEARAAFLRLGGCGDRGRRLHWVACVEALRPPLTEARAQAARAAFAFVRRVAAARGIACSGGGSGGGGGGGGGVRRRATGKAGPVVPLAAFLGAPGSTLAGSAAAAAARTNEPRVVEEEEGWRRVVLGDLAAAYATRVPLVAEARVAAAAVEVGVSEADFVAWAAHLYHRLTDGMGCNSGTDEGGGSEGGGSVGGSSSDDGGGGGGDLRFASILAAVCHASILGASPSAGAAAGAAAGAVPDQVPWAPLLAPAVRACRPAGKESTEPSPPVVVVGCAGSSSPRPPRRGKAAGAGAADGGRPRHDHRFFLPGGALVAVPPSLSMPPTPLEAELASATAARRRSNGGSPGGAARASSSAGACAVAAAAWSSAAPAAGMASERTAVDPWLFRPPPPPFLVVRPSSGAMPLQLPPRAAAAVPGHGTSGVRHTKVHPPPPPPPLLEPEPHQAAAAARPAAGPWRRLEVACGVGALRDAADAAATQARGRRREAEKEDFAAHRCRPWMVPGQRHDDERAVAPQASGAPAAAPAAAPVNAPVNAPAGGAWVLAREEPAAHDLIAAAAARARVGAGLAGTAAALERAAAAELATNAAAAEGRVAAAHVAADRAFDVRAARAAGQEQERRWRAWRADLGREDRSDDGAAAAAAAKAWQQGGAGLAAACHFPAHESAERVRAKAHEAWRTETMSAAAARPPLRHPSSALAAAAAKSNARADPAAAPEGLEAFLFARDDAARAQHAAVERARWQHEEALARARAVGASAGRAAAAAAAAAPAPEDEAAGYYGASVAGLRAAAAAWGEAALAAAALDGPEALDDRRLASLVRGWEPGDPASHLRTKHKVRSARQATFLAQLLTMAYAKGDPFQRALRQKKPGHGGAHGPGELHGADFGAGYATAQQQHQQPIAGIASSRQVRW